MVGKWTQSFSVLLHEQRSPVWVIKTMPIAAQVCLQILTTLLVRVPVLSKHTTSTEAAFSNSPGCSVSIPLILNRPIRHPSAKISIVGALVGHARIKLSTTRWNASCALVSYLVALDTKRKKNHSCRTSAKMQKMK